MSTLPLPSTSMASPTPTSPPRRPAWLRASWTPASVPVPALQLDLDVGFGAAFDCDEVVAAIMRVQEECELEEMVEAVKGAEEQFQCEDSAERETKPAEEGRVEDVCEDALEEDLSKSSTSRTYRSWGCEEDFGVFARAMQARAASESVCRASTSGAPLTTLDEDELYNPYDTEDESPPAPSPSPSPAHPSPVHSSSSSSMLLPSPTDTLASRTSSSSLFSSTSTATTASSSSQTSSRAHVRPLPSPPASARSHALFSSTSTHRPIRRLPTPPSSPAPKPMPMPIPISSPAPSQHTPLRPLPTPPATPKPSVSSPLKFELVPPPLMLVIDADADTDEDKEANKGFNCAPSDLESTPKSKMVVSTAKSAARMGGEPRASWTPPPQDHWSQAESGSWHLNFHDKRTSLSVAPVPIPTPAMLVQAHRGRSPGPKAKPHSRVRVPNLAQFRKATLT